MQAEGREQEPVRVARQQQGQVIVDPLVQSEMRRQPVAGGQVDSCLAFGVGGRLQGLQTRVHRPSV